MKNKNAKCHSMIADCLEALNQATGVEIEGKLKPWPALDAVVEMNIQGLKLELGVELKRHVRQSMLGSLREKLLHYEETQGFPMVLCSEYVDARLATLLKKADIKFFDTAGNAYLHSGAILIYIQGQPKPAGILTRESVGRAFQSAGLKLVFELLRNPQLADCPYRELADMVGISLYAVKRAMDDLREKGFIAGSDKRRRLQQTRRLLEEWCVAYRDRLRPPLVRGRYQAKNPDWWQETDIESVSACWSGEVAATKLGLMRGPQVHTVYCSGKANVLIAAGRLHKQEEGNVELLDAFWHNPKGNLAPDLIVYADLITSGVERNIETAKELYAQRLKDRFA